jgi:hypothetical protein
LKVGTLRPLIDRKRSVATRGLGEINVSSVFPIPDEPSAKIARPCRSAEVDSLNGRGDSDDQNRRD